MQPKKTDEKNISTKTFCAAPSKGTDAAEACWREFEQTGRVCAYLQYKSTRAASACTSGEERTPSSGENRINA